MGVCEALHLTGADVDLDGGVPQVRHAKFDRDRLVPLHPSVTDASNGYVSRRDRLVAARRADALFLSTTGTPLSTRPVDATARSLFGPGGLVNTLIGGQRDGVDIAVRLPVLSTYPSASAPRWRCARSWSTMVIRGYRMGSPRREE